MRNIRQKPTNKQTKQRNNLKILTRHKQCSGYQSGGELGKNDKSKGGGMYMMTGGAWLVSKRCCIQMTYYRIVCLKVILLNNVTPIHLIN